MAGAFIALAALFYTLVVCESTSDAGPSRLTGGLSFSVGLVLVLIAGRELSSGHSLKVLLRNRSPGYPGNLVGALVIAGLVVLPGVLDMPTLSAIAADVARAKLV